MTAAPADPGLVPEVPAFEVSGRIEFWCGPCGPEIGYRREDEGFGHISSGAARVMPAEAGTGRNWVAAE